MQLVRLDSNPHIKDDEWPKHHREESFRFEKADDYPVDESSCVKVPFLGFGKGQQRSSSFEVEISWLDMKNLLREFARIGHPDAVHLRRILKIVKSLEEEGWHSDPEPVEFWDGLLPD